MRTISRRRFIGNCCGSAVAPAFLHAGGSQDVAGLIAKLMRENGVPGASIAVVQNARVAWHREFGVRDVESAARVGDDTAFAAASVSKTVFACAVLQLCDRGVLSLDTPLVKYTPDRILEGDPRLDFITARHVLSHTSGLPNFRSGQEPLKIEFTPGERYRYSGEGYWYLQSVVTRLTGASDSRFCGTYEAGLKVCATDIGQHLATNVLEPFRMSSSGYVWNVPLGRRMARPHDAEGKPLPWPKPTAVDVARYAAMGGLYTTALDYANFLIEIVAPRARAPFRLSDPIRQQMLRPHVEVAESKSWALGWEILDSPNGRLIQHQGGQRGVQAFAAASVDRRSGYVILTNSDNGWKVFGDDRFKDAMNRQLFG